MLSLVPIVKFHTYISESWRKRNVEPSSTTNDNNGNTFGWPKREETAHVPNGCDVPPSVEDPVFSKSKVLALPSTRCRIPCSEPLISTYVPDNDTRSGTINVPVLYTLIS